MNTIDLTAALMSILIENVNAGPIDDAEVCKDIAAYINMLPFGVYYHDSLYDFIREHGEDVEETYIGRDADGEKVYHTFNPESNWHTRIRKELVAMGHYDRYNEWAAAQKVA
jgi:hypothetical protein